MTIRILLADDHGVTREGIRVLLEEKPGIQVVGEAQDGAEMVRLATELRPDLVITEACLPTLNGIDAAGQIIARLADTGIIILSAFADNTLLASALRAGIRGYVLKSYGIEELLKAVETVSAGQIYLSPKVTRLLVDNYLRCLQAVGPSGLAGLSARHRQILQRMAEGRNTKQIAMELSLTPKAIEAARRKIMRTLKVNTVVGLVKFALANHLTPL